MNVFEQATQSFEQQATQDVANPSQEAAPDLQDNTPQEAKQLEAVADLSKYKKIVIDGQELSLEDLKKQRMLEADYRRKTSELAEQRRQHEVGAKFDVNFRADLEVVMQQPWRASEFYKMYPPEFHAQVKQIERMYRTNPSMWASDQGETSSHEQDNSTDYESLIEQKINERLRPLEEKEKMEQHKAHLAQLDAIETKYSAQFKYANKFEVYAAAEYLSKESAEYPGGRELTDADWAKIYKDSHERNLAHYKKAFAEEVQQQKATNQKLKDIPSGGGVPGEAPVVHRTIKDATAAWSQKLG